MFLLSDQLKDRESKGKQKNKVSPQEKQNNDELTKSLTLYMNEKWKKKNRNKTKGAEDIFGKTIANGLPLIKK